MRETQSELIQRVIPVLGDQRLRLEMADHGLEVWLGHSDYPHLFPLPVGRDEDWNAVREAIESIRAEAGQRARIQNTVQQLLDPIDGPDGEA